MAGSSFETKSTTVKRGFKYRYWFAKAKDSKPTLLFFHGFPESKYCYR
jgi:soluble epoxide hydrolase/lipid-phosphate phosphatase